MTIKTDTNTPRNWAIIVAAGVGSRFNSPIPKQYHLLAGISVLQHSIDVFANAPFIDHVVVVVAPDDSYLQQDTLPPKVMVVSGGKERSDSVANGLHALKQLAAPQDWVWIHDGARPCISQTFLHSLQTQLGNNAIGGIPALPVTDTIKQVHNGAIEKTVARELLWRAQTPQIFRYTVIDKAVHSAQQNNTPFTDEASAVELNGLSPQVLTGVDANIKITSAQDLALAGFYLQQMAGN